MTLTSFVYASGTLDQQQTNENDAINIVDSTTSLAETFTAGLTGTLTEIDVVIGCFNGPACVSTTVTMQIFLGTPPGTGPLASTSLPGTSIPLDTGATTPFSAFTFSTPAPEVSGNLYSIILSTNGGSLTYQLHGSKAHPYALGQSYHNSGSGWVAEGWNWAFKTFVTTAAVGGQLQPINAAQVLYLLVTRQVGEYWWLLAAAVIVAGCVVLARRRSQPEKA